MTQFTAQKILFDLDGTLVDTAPDLHAATNHTLQTIDRPPVPIDAVRHMTGFGAVKLIETALETTGGIEGYDFAKLRDVFLEYYSENICVHSALYPYCLDMLKQLGGAGFQLAVCTNKPIGLAVPLLEKLEIYSLFGAVTGGDSYSFKKPDPRHIQKTAELLPGHGPALMVGDASPDILGAQAASIPVIAVDYGYADQPIEALKPNHIIGSLADLPALLRLPTA
ncbi:MAG: phosphoglycolate phosphatase [Kordiimonadales bacterium]|nr:MAG: phosphoglycolate phosphatase [Kordiimonadales bacterium]